MVIQSPGKPEESARLFEGIYISNSHTLLERLIGNRKSYKKLRFYSGYAGWGAGQLESEIARGDWIIIKGDPDLLFDKEADKIWERLRHGKKI
jgi:putative transcriptional regulator